MYDNLHFAGEWRTIQAKYEARWIGESCRAEHAGEIKPASAV